LIAELNRVDTGALAIRTKPGRAVVELLDVPLAYEPNVRLPTGKYKVRVRAAGYETRTIDVRLHKGINEIDVTLQRSEGALTVNVAPAGAEVTLRSDGRQLAYVPGMYLPTGVVEVRVRKAGYRTVVRQVSVRSQGHTLNVVLERFTMREGQLIRDPLATGGEAPEVIVVDAGTMQPGGPAGIGEVQSSIVIDQPFAVSVTEVTVGMYRRYAQATGVAVPEVKGMDSDAHPIADISWREASAYVEWLTRQAGHVYRLPTDDEWIYVAWRGRRDVSLCQLGNIADQSLKKVFRQWRTVDCDDGHTRGAPVGSYQPNALGVYDMVGNVSEWMADCGRGGCVSHVVRGSAWDSAGEELELGYRDSFDRAGDTRGIRLIREL